MTQGLRHTCTDCGTEFILTKDKPGRINQCANCGQNAESVLINEDGTPFQRVGGNMIYQHKTGGQIEIKSLSEARQFNAKTRRLGAGVTASITESKLRAEHIRDREQYRSADWKDVTKN